MTEKEKEIFRQYAPYGTYITKDGERVPFNRGYQPLEDNNRWVENIDRQEYYYDDYTSWEDRLHNSLTKTVIHA